jgi:hypothetical protein
VLDRFKRRSPGQSGPVHRRGIVEGVPTTCPWCDALFEPAAARAGCTATCAACTREFVTAGDTHVTIVTRSGAAGPPPSLVALPPAFTDRWALDRVLGRGAMGMVMRAVDRRTHAPVAVKFLVRAHDDAALARFEREAALLAKLDHPAIVGLLEASHIAGHPFLVMPYCGGGTLADRIASGPLPAGEVVRIASALGAALQACHEAGVVHRDLKPANVLFDDAGQPRLADLGVAKSYAESVRLTAVGALVGTPAYMAPEQVRGEPAGTAADLYALGVLLFEMLAGHPPFEGPLREVFRAHREVEPPRLEELVPELDESLAALVRRLLAKRVADRPGSAADVVRSLERARIALPRPAGKGHWVLLDGAGGVHAMGGRTLYLSARSVHRHPDAVPGDPVLCMVVPDERGPVLMHYKPTGGMRLNGRAVLRGRLADGARIEAGGKAWTAQWRAGPELLTRPESRFARPLDWAREAAELLSKRGDLFEKISMVIEMTVRGQIFAAMELYVLDTEGRFQPVRARGVRSVPEPGTLREALMARAWDRRCEVLYPAGDISFLDGRKPEPRVDLPPMMGCAFAPLTVRGSARGLVYAEDARFRVAAVAREMLSPVRLAAGLIGRAF